MRVLGIDPGAGGALALLSGERLLALHDMPCLVVRRGKRDVRQVDAHLLAAVVASTLPLDVAYIEQVGAMPGQGVSSMFSFGRAAGLIEGVLAGTGTRFEFASPGRWKQEMGVNSSKDSSRQRAVRQWPTWSIEFARAKDDGRAEAALIGLWGARKEGRQGIGTGPTLEEQLAAL